MHIVFDILEEERKRLLQLKKRYQREIAGLPRGSLSRKRRGNRQYCYLAYRAGDKVKFDYVGPAESESVAALAGKLRQRKDLDEKLREAEANLREVDRALRGRR